MKKTLKVIMFVTILAATLFCMTACGKVALNPAEGMVVTFQGADGSGTAHLDFPDNDGTPNYMNTVLESKKIDVNDLVSWLALDQAITYDVEPSSGLSNGDTVTVTINVNESVLENLDLSAEPSTTTFTVSGLQEVVEIDAFENFEVSFSGISPAVTVEHIKSQEIDGVTVRYSREDGSFLKDGESFTIVAHLSDSEYFRLKEDSKTFTVSGVDKYITSNDELLSETFEAMKEKADAVVADQIEDWEGYFHYEGFDYVGYEFWNRSGDSLMGNANAVYLYYRLNANDGNGDFPIYYYVSFEDILQYVDGTQEVDVEDFSRPGSIGFYESLREFDTLESRTNETASKYGKGYEITSFFAN